MFLHWSPSMSIYADPGHRASPHSTASADLAAVASSVIRSLAMIAVAIFLILVALPATLAAAGARVLLPG